jgi:HAD superfamily hydrolase (TIGR01509 family)
VLLIAMPIDAVVFDMDGVLLDSEGIWEKVLDDLLELSHATWTDADREAFVGGDNSRQWASYLIDRKHLPFTEDALVQWVTGRVLATYSKRVPLLPGAAEAVRRMAGHYRLGLASSSPPSVIAYVLEASGLAGFFAAWVSSDHVPRGKPAPDVYLEACRLLAVAPGSAVAIEDAPHGMQAARDAGMRVIGIPGKWFPLGRDAAPAADRLLSSITELTPEFIATLDP